MKCSTRLFLVLLALVVGVSSVRGMTFKDEDAAPIADPCLDLVRVEWSRMGENAGCVIHFLDTPQAERVRILIDVDGPDRGVAPSGADFMVEGRRFYQHTGMDDAWTWDAIGEVALIEDGRALRLLLPEFEHGSAFRWSVETLSSELAAVDRYPSSGLADTRWASLEGGGRTEATAVDLRGLLEYNPLTLSYRFDTELKAVIWPPAREPLPMAWQPSSITSSIPFVLTLEDMAAGTVVTAVVESCSAVSNAIRWVGATEGLAWTLVGEIRGDGLQLTGQLKSGTERRVRVGIVFAVPADLWSVEEPDDEVARMLDARNVESGFPLGIVGGRQGTISVENDMEEPRRFRIGAGSDSERTLSIVYDLGLTMATSNFPGRSTFRCYAHYLADGGGCPQREALADFYRRHPATSQRRLPRAEGWWAGSGAADGWSEDLVEMDDGQARGGKRLRFAAMSPWTYGQLIPDGFSCDEETAQRLVKWAALGGGREGDLAVSALLGVARDGEGRAMMTVSSEPVCLSGWSVGVDPDLAGVPDLPVTRAMAEWKLVIGSVGKTCDGVLLKAGWVWDGLNHDAAALGVADYPCACEDDDPAPGLAGDVSAMELVVPLAGAVRARGGFLAGEIPGALGAGMVSQLDVMVGPSLKLHDEVGGLLRILAGEKPAVIPLDLGGLPDDEAKTILSRLLYWGYLPALESVRDESARGSFAPYLSVMSRIAEAGWNPQRKLSVTGADITAEEFGRDGIRHVTLHNRSGEWATASISCEPAAHFIFCVDPFTAAVAILEPGSTSLSCRVASGVSVRDWIVMPDVAGEIDFLKSWETGMGEGGAVLRSLASAADEVKQGFVCELVCPQPAVRGETNVAVLTVSNHSDQAVRFSDLKVVSSKQFLPFDEATAPIAAGETARFEAAFREEDMGDEPWLEVQWALEGNGSRLDCVRMMRPDFVDPLLISAPSTNVTSSSLEGEIALEVRSYSSRERTVRLHWEGDFKGGDMSIVVKPDSRSTVRLPIKGARKRAGQMVVRASADGETVFSEFLNVALGGEE